MLTITKGADAAAPFECIAMFHDMDRAVNHLYGCANKWARSEYGDDFELEIEPNNMCQIRSEVHDDDDDDDGADSQSDTWYRFPRVLVYRREHVEPSTAAWLVGYRTEERRTLVGSTSMFLLPVDSDRCEFLYDWVEKVDTVEPYEQPCDAPPMPRQQ